MRVALVLHGRRTDALMYAREAVSLLRAAGALVLMEDEYLNEFGPAVSPLSEADGAEILLALGGDGTLLRGAQYALKWGASLMGINLGRVGFLAEVEKENMAEAISRLMRGEYVIEERAVLAVHAQQGDWYAVNDVVVTRGGYSRLISISAVVDGDSAGRYVADGLIVATPTGSTGYSISAGGPVIAPKVDCMVITPVCAHSLQHRPTIVQGSACIALTLDDGDSQSAALQIDGQSRAEMTEGMSITVSKAPVCLRLIHMKDRPFFGFLREKLAEWTR